MEALATARGYPDLADAAAAAPSHAPAGIQRAAAARWMGSGLSGQALYDAVLAAVAGSPGAVAAAPARWSAAETAALNARRRRGGVPAAPRRRASWAARRRWCWTARRPRR